MKKIPVIFLLLIICTILYSQPPHYFTQTAHVDLIGPAFDVVQDSSGTVFVTHRDDGLRAYSYDGFSFTNIAHLNNVGSLALDSAGTIFIANDDLWAYTFDGSSFTNTAHINNTGSSAIAVGPDGTVFVTNLYGDLRAYSYDGSSFNNTASINTGNIPHDVAVGADGTVFVANYWDGLRAYTYDGSSFTNTAHIYNGGSNNGRAFRVIVDLNGTIFLGNANDGLRAYTYNGSSFTNTAHINNGVSEDEAWGVAVGSDNIVFVCYGGLTAYRYDGSSFTNTAQIYPVGSGAWDVTIGSDGTVFVTALWDGLYSYTYSGYVGFEEYVYNLPSDLFLSQNYPNPFNSRTNIEFSISKAEFVTLKIYNLLGQEVTTLVSDKLNAGKYIYSWDASGFASGIYYYTLESEKFQENKKLILLK